MDQCEPMGTYAQETEMFDNLWRADRVRRDPLPLRTSRCEECPAGDMYLPINEALRRQPKDRQVHHVTRAECHMTPQCACRGGAEEVGVVEDAIELYRRTRHRPHDGTE